MEPLGGKRHIKITERRTRIDWAHVIKEMLEERYGDAKKVVLVMDNLNTHHLVSLYTAFALEVARGLAERLEIHYTPKHGKLVEYSGNRTERLETAMSGRKNCEH